ncbi:lyase [Streptomyces sp. NPDC047928]|uniref:terpene synthase family protein n=1 Tax=unclassified Streptomyces TaxID=2593676 RepID=UPI00371F472A
MKHPRAAEANADATEWVLSHGLVTDAAEEFAGIGFGHLAARVSGDASYEDIVLLAQWMAWSFVLDDQHDHLIRSGGLRAWRPVADAITGHLATDGTGGRPMSRPHPLVDGFIDLCDRILARMPEGIRARYRAHVPLMLRSLDQEAVNRRAGGRPEIDDYILMRRHSSQLLPMMDMVEAGLGIEVPQEVHDSPQFQRLVHSAVDVISWGNDVFSLPKEYSCGDNNNLVSLLSSWNGWTLRKSVEAVEERIRSRVEDFRTGARRLPQLLDVLALTGPSEREAVARCVRSYEDWMIGADLWQRYECTRYSDERFAAGLEGAYTNPDLFSAA